MQQRSAILVLALAMGLCSAFPQGGQHQEVEPVFVHHQEEAAIKPEFNSNLHPQKHEEEGVAHEQQEQQQQEHHQQQPHHLQQQQEEEHHNGARGFAVGRANDKDREAFVTMINSLLWDADEDVEVGGSADHARNFVHQFRQKGLFGMKMPEILREEGSYPAEMYRGFVDTCYDTVCTYGLAGFASSLANLFG